MAVWRHAPAGFQALMRFRAWRKFRHIEPFLPRLKSPLAVLDLGAAEGYIGQWIQLKKSADVTLCDVLDLNRTNLMHVVYDGKQLPWGDNAFDVIVLYFVLHHCEDQRRLMHEALRVASGRVIVMESVYTNELDRRMLTILDRWANRLRSRRQMNEQEGRLRFRTATAWRHLFKELRSDVLVQQSRGFWPYKQAMFILGLSRTQQ